MSKFKPAKDEQREPLEFESETGTARSTVIAGGLLVVTLVWMGSGFFIEAQTPNSATNESRDTVAVTVATQISNAEDIVLNFEAEGVARSNRDSLIHAEVDGEVVEVAVEKGQDVSEGDLIVRLKSDEAEAEFDHAKEALEQAQIEYKNTNELLKRGVATTDRLVRARVELAAARAAHIAAEETLNDKRIVAPFTGRIEALEISKGEYLTTQREVARLVDNEPLLVAFQIPQQSLPKIKVGKKAKVRFITGVEVEGLVTFVATTASDNTRTFLAEVEVPNAGSAIAAGISAEVRIDIDIVRAHRISPALLSLNEDGVTGVKLVENGKAVFYPIRGVRSDPESLWVRGLPAQAELITIGQGFVRDGENVKAQQQQQDIR